MYTRKFRIHQTLKTADFEQFRLEEYINTGWRTAHLPASKAMNLFYNQRLKTPGEVSILQKMLFVNKLNARITLNYLMVDEQVLWIQEEDDTVTYMCYG